jgi:flagellar motor component MotA
MITFLLCLIVAILLFGASKILGAFSKVLGFIILLIGLIALSKITDVSVEAIIGVVLLIVLGGAGYFAIFHPEEWKEAQKKK